MIITHTPSTQVRLCLLRFNFLVQFVLWLYSQFMKIYSSISTISVCLCLSLCAGFFVSKLRRLEIRYRESVVKKRDKQKVH